MKVGYARISTKDQDLSLQIAALKRAGCSREHIFTDTTSGRIVDRPGLDECLSFLRPKDQLVVWKLDRLGRTVKGLIELITDLERRKVQFQSVTEGIDTTTAGGRFFFHVLAAFAEMERELIVERTRAGLAAAKALGRQGGAPRKLTAKKLKAAKILLAQNTPPKEVAAHFHIGVSTLYRHLAKEIPK